MILSPFKKCNFQKIKQPQMSLRFGFSLDCKEFIFMQIRTHRRCLFPRIPSQMLPSYRKHTHATKYIHVFSLSYLSPTCKNSCSPTAPVIMCSDMKKNLLKLRLTNFVAALSTQMLKNAENCEIDEEKQAWTWRAKAIVGRIISHSSSV